MTSPPPYGQLSVIFLVCAKKQVLLAPKHCFKPFLLGQNLHICLRSAMRGLTPHPPPPLPHPPYGQPDRIRYSCFFTTHIHITRITALKVECSKFRTSDQYVPRAHCASSTHQPSCNFIGTLSNNRRKQVHLENKRNLTQYFGDFLSNPKI